MNMMNNGAESANMSMNSYPGYGGAGVSSTSDMSMSMGMDSSMTGNMSMPMAMPIPGNNTYPGAYPPGYMPQHNDLYMMQQNPHQISTASAPQILMSPQKQTQQGSASGKYLCTFYVGIDEDPQFHVAKRIIGPGGVNMKNISKIVGQGGKIRLRGIGSGFAEKPTGMEADEPLQVNISAPSQEAYLITKYMISQLLLRVYDDYSTYTSGLRRGILKLSEHPMNSPIDPMYEAQLYAHHPVFQYGTKNLNAINANNVNLNANNVDTSFDQGSGVKSPTSVISHHSHIQQHQFSTNNSPILENNMGGSMDMGVVYENSAPLMMMQPTTTSNEGVDKTVF